MLRFLFGIFCGITVGMVVAPASGDETRRQLLDKVEELKIASIEKGRDTARDVGATVGERLYDRAISEENRRAM